MSKKKWKNVTPSVQHNKMYWYAVRQCHLALLTRSHKLLKHIIRMYLPVLIWYPIYLYKYYVFINFFYALSLFSVMWNANWCRFYLYIKVTINCPHTHNSVSMDVLCIYIVLSLSKIVNDSDKVPVLSVSNCSPAIIHLTNEKKTVNPM